MGTEYSAKSSTIVKVPPCDFDNRDALLFGAAVAGRGRSCRNSRGLSRRDCPHFTPVTPGRGQWPLLQNRARSRPVAAPTKPCQVAASGRSYRNGRGLSRRDCPHFTPVTPGRGQWPLLQNRARSRPVAAPTGMVGDCPDGTVPISAAPTKPCRGRGPEPNHRNSG